jgi:serine/threonine-protein kinase
MGTDPPRIAGPAKIAKGSSQQVPPPPPMSTPAPPSRAVPERFDKYQVLRHLASGGMAEVYLARTSGIEGFEKLVVIKSLKPEHMSDGTATWLFLQEARIAATLEHPQIAQVYDVGEVGGSYFFAMEYVDGQDLRHVMNAAIERQRPIRLEDSLRVAIELCGALQYAHDKLDSQGQPLGLVHRDVSPSNVLISNEGAVKLCDFGVAEVAAASKDPKRRTLAGKLSYMSPEQLRAEPLDRRSDIFGLSVMLYELTTLTKVFTGKRNRDVVRQILEGRVAPPSSLRAGRTIRPSWSGS